MKRIELPAEATMGVYIALGNARTPQALAALEGVMEDERAPVIERSRAILALIDRDDVDLGLAGYLQEKSNDIASGQTEGARVLARQSILALGAMSGRKPWDEDLKASALAQAARLLEETRDMDAAYQRPVFGALANIGDPSSLSMVSYIPDHLDADVREAAAIIFRRMPPEESSEFAARWLANETDANVKRKLWHTIELQTFDAREMISREVLEFALRDLRQRPGFITRKALIRLLGRAREEMPKDELGISDAFAELIPFEFEQNSGFHRMMDEHIEPRRREEIYLEVARSFEHDPSQADTPAHVPEPPAAEDSSDPIIPPGGFGPPTGSATAGGIQ
jgi:hypothetical protein